MHTPLLTVFPNEQLNNTNTLIITCGPPGVGKSTVAKLTAQQTTGTILRTDTIRKELYTNPTYSTEETQHVYTELLNRATELLQENKTVILDGTFSQKHQRKNALTIGRDYANTTKILRVTCDESIVKQRITDRDDVSDADYDVHEQVKSEFDEVQHPHTRIHNNAGTEQLVDQIAIGLF